MKIFCHADCRLAALALDGGLLDLQVPARAFASTVSLSARLPDDSMFSRVTARFDPQIGILQISGEDHSDEIRSQSRRHIVDCNLLRCSFASIQWVVFSFCSSVSIFRSGAVVPHRSGTLVRPPRRGHAKHLVGAHDFAISPSQVVACSKRLGCASRMNGSWCCHDSPWACQ